ncbi:hypothetical protein A0J61_00782 [Choanephora cucurbitarum]|uniref:Uncharacterized protein n=1 Tax=Choanephora cucurbitarum TaxID=101091 RepID=A0A1C7NPZ9_9FUNG|nr:hypothetical protein A0J61_00782 [Choanephora cucurbitarum]
MLLFKGSAILCFYSNGMMQGHCIDGLHSPYSLAGSHLVDRVDPLHHDCMEPDDFYSLLICPHQNPTEKIALTVRRPKENDAGGLCTHPHEEEINQQHSLSFETHQFLTGQKAQVIRDKYFAGIYSDQEVVVCIGPMEFSKEDVQE